MRCTRKKKLYEALEMQITEFETEDVIATSTHNLDNSDLYGEPTESGTGEDGGTF